MNKYLTTILVIFIMLFTGCNDSGSIPGVKYILNSEIKFGGGYTVEELKIPKDKLKTPYGVCNFNENMVVCDYDEHKLVLLNQNGEYQSSFGNIGSGEGEFLNPAGITVHNNCLYVLDSGNNRVQVFDSEYTYLTEMKLNVLVHQQGGYCYTDIAVDNDGVVYVTTDCIGKEDAHIYILKNGEIFISEETFVGYLTEYKGEVYAVNTLELTHKINEDIGESGENAMYLLDKQKMKKILDLPKGFSPIDFIISDTNSFLISGSMGCLSSFSLQGEYAGELCKFHKNSYSMYIDSTSNGDYFVTETGDKKIFLIKKNVVE